MGALHLSLVESIPSSITFIFGVYVQMLCVPRQACGGHTTLLEVGFLVELGTELMSFDQWVCASTHWAASQPQTFTFSATAHLDLSMFSCLKDLEE